MATSSQMLLALQENHSPDHSHSRCMRTNQRAIRDPAAAEFEVVDQCRTSDTLGLALQLTKSSLTGITQRRHGNMPTHLSR